MQAYDVAIIGGGIIGNACAYYLSKLGASVVVIEREQLNCGASGRNAGSLHFQLEHRLIHNAEHLKTQLPHLIPLTLTAIEQWRDLADELQCDIGLGMSGGLMVAETDSDVALLRHKAKIERDCGLAVQLLTAADARARVPCLSSRIQAALFCPDEGHCNPRLLTPAFARAARRLGASYRVNSRVIRLQRLRDDWRLHCAATGQTVSASCQIQAGAVLNAAGAWAQSVGLLANVHLPLFPVALCMSVTEPAPKFLGCMVQHVGRKLSLKQVAEGHILVGGGWSARLPLHRGAWQQERPAEIDYDALQGNLQTATDVVPALQQLQLLRTWTGITAVTTDQLPIVGEVTQAPGFYVAAGGSGFTFGPTYARLLSEAIVSGHMPELLQPYAPARFDHINMFMGV